MNNRFSSWRSCCLILASLLLGTLAAQFFKPVSVGVAKETRSTVAPQPRGQFVQEPTQRLSLRPRLPGIRKTNQRSNFFVLRAFHDAIGNSWKSTAQIVASGKQVALGAIVGADGWVITKASQLPDTEIRCRLYDNREVQAEVVEVVTDLDLALLHIPEHNLPTVVWGSSIPVRGNWVATTDLKTTPRAVGVVSTGIQRIGKLKPVLGVKLDDSENGARVTEVMAGTGADHAGLREEDNIYEVNGIQISSYYGFKQAIATAKGGELIQLGINRRDRKFMVKARLMDLSYELLDGTEMEVNGRISARSTGFERVLMHDTVLQPNVCGGPLVNLDGRVVGINIARAGRVSSYALPTDVVQPLVNRLIEQAKLVSKSDPQSTLRPVR